MKITEESMRQENNAQNTAPAPRPEPEPKRTEREKLRSMNSRDKIWYIWTYYKVHIAAALIAVMAIGAAASILYRASFQTSLSCVFIGNPSENDVNITPLTHDFAAYLGLGPKDVIQAETILFSSDSQTTEYGYAATVKLTALISAKSLDIIIADTEFSARYARQGAFLDLEEALDAETSALIREHLYRLPDENGQEHAYAVDLSGTAFAEASGLTQNPPLFSIITNSINLDNAKALLRYIFSQP